MLKIFRIIMKLIVLDNLNIAFLTFNTVYGNMHKHVYLYIFLPSSLSSSPLPPISPFPSLKACLPAFLPSSSLSLLPSLASPFFFFLLSLSVLTQGHVYQFDRGREGGRERNKHHCVRETSICCFSHATQLGTGPQPRQVPRLGTQP